MDKDDLIRLKSETVKVLTGIDVDSYGLKKTDERLPFYIKSCIGNPGRHNLYELLAIKRFFDLFEKYEYRRGDVRKFIVLFETLKFSGESFMFRSWLPHFQMRRWLVLFLPRL